MNFRGRGARYEACGINTSGSTGTTITSGTSPSKGSWAQLIASTAFDANLIQVHARNQDTYRHGLIDIGIGAAASEKVLIPDLCYMEYQGQRIGWGGWPFFRVKIPEGSRISARWATSSSARDIDISCLLGDSALGVELPFGLVTAMGADTTNNRGTAITMSGSVDTKSAWTQMVASTTHPIYELWIHIDNNSSPALTTGFGLLDVAIGAAASEQIIIPDVPFMGDSAGDGYNPCWLGPFQVNIPAGTRIAIRAAYSVASMPFGAMIYGSY